MSALAHRWQWVASDRAPSLARRAVRRCGLVPAELIGDVLLMVSELVTNAELYGGSPISLTVRADGERVHVEVGDRQPSLMLSARDPDRPHGLEIVASLADQAGIRFSQAGKSAWFDVGGGGALDGGRVGALPLSAAGGNAAVRARDRAPGR